MRGQGDQMSGKPGNVREFCSCQGKVQARFGVRGEQVRDGRSAAKGQGNVREFYIDWRVVTLVQVKL